MFIFPRNEKNASPPPPPPPPPPPKKKNLAIDQALIVMSKQHCFGEVGEMSNIYNKKWKNNLSVPILFPLIVHLSCNQSHWPINAKWLLLDETASRSFIKCLCITKFFYTLVCGRLKPYFLLSANIFNGCPLESYLLCFNFLFGKYMTYFLAKCCIPETDINSFTGYISFAKAWIMFFALNVGRQSGVHAFKQLSVWRFSALETLPHSLNGINFQKYIVFIFKKWKSREKFMTKNTKTGFFKLNEKFDYWSDHQ